MIDGNVFTTKRKFTWRSVAFFLTLFGFIFVWTYFFEDRRAEYQSVLINSANAINQKCPMKLDSVLQLENAVVEDDLTLRYNYTVNSFYLADFSVETYQKNLKEEFQIRYVKDRTIRKLLDDGVNFHFALRSSSGGPLADWKLSKADLK